MIVHVFVGPTLPRGRVREELPGARVSGPVAFGDVYRSVRAGSGAIAIIDGYFERVPAVWHKEILWAMSEGVHVFGASSMGALRAAELADLGMQGVGQIFEAYRQGELEDDDEVTIAHAAAEAGFAAHSEAMVNLRATFASALESGVISARTSTLLVAVAKQRFYAERSYAAALRDAEQAGTDVAELSALRSWLPTGRVDRKAEDALRLLRHVQDWQRTAPKPLRVDYRFEPTDAWLEAARAAERSVDELPLATTLGQEALEEELKLAGIYTTARDAAVARAAAIDEARRAGFHPDVSAVTQAAETVRQDLGLIQREAFERWRQRERIDDESLVQIFEDQARVAWASHRTHPAAATYLADSLRMRGGYGEYARKAENKTRNLAGCGPRTPSLADLGMTEASLWRWYFGEKRSQTVPDDLYVFARALGFADLDEMRAAVLRELQSERVAQTAK